MEIVAVNFNEVEMLQQISRQTFHETFSDTNTEENMQKFLDEAYNIVKLKAEMENPDSAFYFARHGEKVAGYLKINVGQAQTEKKDPESLEIERIYVLKEFLGRGVGQLLYNKAYDIAKNGHYKYLWLGVWEKNSRAINFYRKNGFVEFDKHLFMLGDDEQTDIMMKFEL